MNRNIYKIEWEVVLQWMIPSVLRVAPMYQWVKALIEPVTSVYESFIKFKDAKEYELKITPQVCYLETLLNDRYDNNQRRIFIEDGEGAEVLWLYTDDELQPVNLYTDEEDLPVILNTEGEVDGEQANDYIINIPMDVSFSRLELIALIKKFHLPGMHFDIQLF